MNCKYFFFFFRLHGKPLIGYIGLLSAADCGHAGLHACFRLIQGGGQLALERGPPLVASHLRAKEQQRAASRSSAVTFE